MRIFQYNNTKIYLGKTDVENTELVVTYNNMDYTWFHLSDYPSAHLVIEKSKDSLSDDEIMFCANLIKYYHKLRKEWTKKYYIDIVSTKNVKPQIKPGLVTVSKVKKIKIKPCFNFNPEEFIYKKNEI